MKKTGVWDRLRQHWWQPDGTGYRHMQPSSPAELYSLATLAAIAFVKAVSTGNPAHTLTQFKP